MQEKRNGLMGSTPVTTGMNSDPAHFSPLSFSPGKLASRLQRRIFCLSLQHLSLWRTYSLGSHGKSKRITWSTPVESIPRNNLSYG
ncbi:hypothetical protein EUGRSUZ_B02193 [Eucalyptus grandis]|uniref:Uncharacterized protein n=2 Tax=Eucalyptus grandis TaxID=71139 RepID=A0ACC3LT09_EUCGR|nr:hypothetical protein EUGRSUZ_B02193 [Eucalyptus grandis]